MEVFCGTPLDYSWLPSTMFFGTFKFGGTLQWKLGCKRKQNPPSHCTLGALRFDPARRTTWKHLCRPPEILAFYMKDHRSENSVFISIFFFSSGITLIDYRERLLMNPGTGSV